MTGGYRSSLGLVSTNALIPIKFLRFSSGEGRLTNYYTTFQRTYETCKNGLDKESMGACALP